MNEKVVPIKPEDPAAKDIRARLEKIEDTFLVGLQDIRTIKAELSELSNRTPALEKLLSCAAVAELLGESTKWVQKQIKTYRLPAYKLGKEWKISPTALAKWIEQRKTA